MQHIKLKTYAKTNLCLDIVGKRSDGYHDLETIMQSLELADELKFCKAPKMSISCNHPSIPVDEGNLAYQAAKRLLSYAGIKSGVRILIDKRIPVAAGLGGGSTNAAGTLLAVNFLYELNLTIHQLISVGKELGADVPFCLVGGTVLATGIGERLRFLSPLKKAYLVLVKPELSISTKSVYAKVDLNNLQDRPDIKRATKGIEMGDLSILADSMGNALEPITSLEHPVVKEIKSAMLSLGAAAAQMCGSGPTVFAFCYSMEQAIPIYNHFKGIYQEVFLCETKA